MKLRGLHRRSASTAPSKSAAARDAATKGQRIREAGQIIAIFAIMLTALIGLVGIAIDVTFAWREELRVQRAADAAALAGVVYLPGDVPNGTTKALAEATKNGYTTNAPTTTVSAAQDGTNPRQMDVSITTSVPTFFVRVFGINSFSVSRAAKAVFILPVPMGSPDPYYGSFGTFNINDASGHPVATTLTGPGGAPMVARGFWGSMVTQGAGAASGDAYLPKHNAASMTGTNPIPRDVVNHYDYAIKMPAGSTGGHVWIFDPVFCDTDGKLGTGEMWLSGTNPVSSFFNLYDTHDSPYDLSAHTLMGGSGDFFTNMKYSDSREGGSGGTECKAGSTSDPSDPRFFHNGWYDLTARRGIAEMAGGMTGHTYRLRTTTDPGDSSEDSTNGYNNFAIYVTATGGAAQVYGLAAMQMYTPLPGGATSEFYLAQIDPESGAGKTMEVQLWDPGDTNTLTARLRILQPTTTGWSAVPTLNWTSVPKTTDATCSAGTGSGSYIETATAGTKKFNGCWVIIDIVIPGTYTAPMDGWWKISYQMGTEGGNATDETTWQVNIRGNPVHLIP